MKCCILGVTGLLGQALSVEAENRNIEICGVARSNAQINLDITNKDDLKDFIINNNFDIVINTCAIVNHAFCDEHPEAAYCTNARPSAILANLSKECSFKYVYISTDGYFRGDKNAAHDEKAQVFLLNEYAITKYAGEMFSLTNPESLVVRTNIVGFKNGNQPTFLEWVINSIKENTQMTLFDDYFTSSISVAQFSKSLFDLLLKNPSGIINLASSEVFSKADFIIKLAKALNMQLNNPITGSVASLSSKRADSLGLDVSKAEAILGYKLPNSDDVINQLAKEYYELYK